jgi:hypothetical protein
MPSKGFRWMQQISQFSNALLRSASSTSSIRNSQISQSIRAFAQEKVWYTGESVVFENMIGKMVYPLGLSFLLPMFVLTLVREKEDKILIMMKMHGLSTVKYYLAHYLHFMILQIACSIVFIVTAVGFQLKFFVETSPAVYLPAFLGWANAMVALSFLLSVFFNRVRLAMGKFD